MENGFAGVNMEITGKINHQFRVSVPGVFTGYNALAAISVCSLIGIDIDTITAKYYHEYSDKSIAFCANCWAAKMCPFCYSDRMTENGISENAHLHCAEARAHLKKQFSLYHELLETSPEKLAVLNKYVTQ